MKHISTKIQTGLCQLENPQLATDLWHILEEQHFQGFLPHFSVEHLCQKYRFTAQQLALILLPIMRLLRQPDNFAF